VFNLVPCDNEFELQFAKFLQTAKDVVAFSKLPEAFGFAVEYTDPSGNLRYYFPDFVAVTKSGEHYLVETKGQETAEVPFKDRAATNWTESASRLTGVDWRYVKVPQAGFNQLQPDEFSDLQAFSGCSSGEL
jgi:type III restriction enzyme